MLLASLGLIGVGGWLMAHAMRPVSYRVNMLTDDVPNRFLLARRIAESATRHGLDVQLSSRSYGAIEALDLVDRPNPIDLAMVPGGVLDHTYPRVRQVTALTIEPLHLLVRPELAAHGLSGLRGRRINLGGPSSACRAIAQDVLAFAGLHAAGEGRSGDYVSDLSTPPELQQMLGRLQGLSGDDRRRELERLPDASFVVSAMPSLVVRDLVLRAGYRLLPLPFADAYCMDRITPTEAGGVSIDRGAFTPVEIPAYTYGIDPAVPAGACRTIGARLLLIGQASTSPASVSRLLEAIFDGSIRNFAEPQPLRDQVQQYPFHPGTERFLHRNDPILTPDMVSSLGKAAGGLGAFASGIVAFYGFLRLRQLRRFELYYQEIRRIELIARGQEIDPSAPADPEARREYLEDRLLDLKSDALKDFAEGGLKGESLMSGIVALVNDTRNSLRGIAVPVVHDHRTPEAARAESS
jgi:TRAP-type uncharacterized transport system substrate-binding protein